MVVYLLYLLAGKPEDVLALARTDSPIGGRNAGDLLNEGSEKEEYIRICTELLYEGVSEVIEAGQGALTDEKLGPEHRNVIFARRDVVIAELLLVGRRRALVVERHDTLACAHDLLRPGLDG